MEDLKNLPHVTSLHKDLQVEYKEAVVGKVTGFYLIASWGMEGHEFLCVGHQQIQMEKCSILII